MDRVLIANRGEIASRIARSLKKMNIFTIGVATLWDINLPYIWELDFVHHEPTFDATSVFLNKQFLIELAKKYNCCAIHPGYGFLSENSEFARLCRENGLLFIGPPPEAISKLGSKVLLKEICAQNSVPTIQRLDPLSPEISSHLPILIKGADSGGGRGMRVVWNVSELASAIEAAKAELGAFGGGHLFAEKFLEPVKHIEVQVIVDHQGQPYALLERDCSAQRKFQKIVEESPCPSIDSSLRDTLLQNALKIAAATGFPSLYTYEFLITGSDFFLSEINTRLQVEHTVTEEIYGVDLVEIQTLIAFKQSIPTNFTPLNRHSIQLRLYAEDPVSFEPSPGYLKRLRFNDLPSRLESTYLEGCLVSPAFDPLICKIIQTEEKRAAVIEKLVKVLNSLELAGVNTNKDLLLWILGNSVFQSGDYDTSLVKAYVPSKSCDESELNPVENTTPTGESVHRSPILGTVSKILTTSNTVRQGETVLFIDSMKIQHPIFATKSGSLCLLVKEGDVVKKGDVLFVVS